jgi:formate dehydrogenase subunit delta
VNTKQKLVYMANQIAANFARLGEPAAVAATSDHIARFWDPGMRRKILEQLDESEHGLSAAAAAAIRALETRSQ